jgi:hypothetical protein
MPEQHHPRATLPYLLSDVQQSAASSGTIHWPALAGLPWLASAGKVSVEESVFLQEDSYANIHSSLSHITRRSLRP